MISAREPRVRVIEGETCRGIQHGFRTCLEAATCEWIVPIDADDVLEADALAVMASTIASRPADFVFSDEDHLVDGQLRSRYARPGFDPVLNIESSYIWHLSAFRRDRALASRRVHGFGRRAVPRLGHEHAIRTGGRGDGARAARALPLAQP